MPYWQKIKFDNTKYGHFANKLWCIHIMLHRHYHYKNTTYLYVLIWKYPWRRILYLTQQVEIKTWVRPGIVVTEKRTERADILGREAAKGAKVKNQILSLSGWDLLVLLLKSETEAYCCYRWYEEEDHELVKSEDSGAKLWFPLSFYLAMWSLYSFLFCFVWILCPLSSSLKRNKNSQDCFETLRIKETNIVKVLRIVLDMQHMLNMLAIS